MSDSVIELQDVSLDDLGTIKSSYKLIQRVTEKIEKNLLLENEILNKSPASFTNIFLEEFGRINALSYYEQMMYKNEMLPNTAIRLRSLYNKMDESTIPQLFASPSKISFVLGYQYDDIVRLAVGSSYQKKLILNKNTEFSISGQDVTFRLDHDIEIIVSNPGQVTQNVYAKYDQSDKLNQESTLSAINNPFIPYQIVMINRIKYFLMFIEPRQFKRTITDYDILNEMCDFSVMYEDKLYGFEIHYKGKTSKHFKYIEGKHDGILNVDGYNFSIDPKKSIIYFNFNQNPDYFAPDVGDVIRVLLYTTKGKSGNFVIPDIYNRKPEDLGLAIDFKQERGIPEQDRILTLIPFLSIRNGVVDGGRDPLSIKEVKELVIRRGSGIKVISPGEIERMAKEEYNLYAEKIRDDIRCLEYRFLGVLRNQDDSSVIASSTYEMRFNFNAALKAQNINSYIISPKHVYEDYEDSDTSRIIEMNLNPEDFNEYFEKYKLGNNKSSYCFPYHIRFDANKLVQAKIYDLNVFNELYELDFVFFNDKTTEESSILNLVVNRDPINERIESLGLPLTTAKGYYELKFVIATSHQVIGDYLRDPNSDTPLMKYRVRIINRDSQDSFILDCKIDQYNEEDNLISIIGYLLTDDAIDNYNRVAIVDGAIQPFPYVLNPSDVYFLESNIDIEIYAIQKSTGNDGVFFNTVHDRILTDEEIDNRYFISTVYKSDKIKLFEDLTKKTNFISDIRIEPAEYAYYTEDEYATYEETVYEYDENGEIITVEVPIDFEDGSITASVPKVKYEKGSIIEDENGNPVIKHKAGSPKFDINNKPVISKPSYYRGIIKGFPVYDRIYSLGDNYKIVLNAYRSIFNSLKSIETFIPDGMTIIGSIKNTKAKGEWEVYNIETSSWDLLDSISLSFDIGVKYDSIIDSNAIVNNNNMIVEIIDNFINDFDDISFSIDNIFDEIKDRIPNIKYLILYKINNYTANQVQSIRKKDDNEYVVDALSVRRAIDIKESDIDNDIIKFKPDITIREIK